MEDSIRTGKKPTKRTRRNYQYSESVGKEIEYKNLNDLSSIKGLKKIEISPLTQKFVECRVGDNVTSDTFWIFVDKEKIEDHLDLYEKKSDFYSIMADIKNMPNKKILFGTQNFTQEEKVEFYICLTNETQEALLKSTENKKRVLQEKLINAMRPTSRKWQSLGSEYLVNSGLNLNLRPLIVVDLEGCMPIKKQNVHFSIRNVENIRNGYTELITTRSSINIIIRKRIETGVQHCMPKKSVGVQVIKKNVSNKNIGFSGNFNDISTDDLLIELKKFIETKLAEIKDMLILNFSLNLYYDDYLYLRKVEPLDIMTEPTEIRSYQDVIKCRHRKISCFTWNAIISGYVATAYAATPIFSFGKQRSTHNEDYEIVFEEHLVLIWHYSDSVKPKLYLHATRDVTALSFCPYNANILVGGYDNGQIIVWDLTNKLQHKKIREYLTDVQENNHLLIEKNTRWFKPPLSEKHVFPILRSSLTVGHHAAVTTVQWIPSSKYMAPTRIYKDSSEDRPHMQFITVSLDGEKILVWDLYIPEQYQKTEGMKRLIRLSKKPGALILGLSPLTFLKKHFQPVCRLIVKHLSYPITTLLVQNQIYNYVAENPETLNDIYKTTYFTVSEKTGSFDYSPKLFFTTGIGTFHEATWEESDFDPKYYAVNEKCKISKYIDIHDGPVLVCEMNPVLPNVILTVGGSVFAIWFITRIKAPVIWRKSKVKYLTGMWSTHHPLCCFLIRNDTYYEMWNMLERSNLPMQIFKYKGFELTSIYKDISRSHVRKSTCVITDKVGAFKIFTVPSESLKIKFNINESLLFLEILLKVKENVKYIVNNFCKKQLQSISKIEKEEIPVIEKTIEEPKEIVLKKEVILTKKMKYDMKLEKEMRAILYKRKKINLAEIAKKMTLVKSTLSDINTKEKKLAKKKSERETIFKKARNQILYSKVQKARQPSFRIETENIKEIFFTNYVQMEEETIIKIKENPHILKFSWPEVLKRRKEHYKTKQLLLIT